MPDPHTALLDNRHRRAVPRRTPHYPSKPLSPPNGSECARPAAPTYTGTALLGIATMHKSNAVPVASKEAAEDISKMRRN